MLFRPTIQAHDIFAIALQPAATVPAHAHADSPLILAGLARVVNGKTGQFRTRARRGDPGFQAGILEKKP